MSDKIYIASDGDTVDAVAWKNYGTTAARVVERVLVANPGLADLGPMLPAGTKIILPQLDTATAKTGTRLWD